MNPTDPARQPGYPPSQPGLAPPGPGPGYPPAGPPSRPLRLGDLLAGGGALAVFVFSFAPFVSLTGNDLLAVVGVRTWHNAWAAETFMAPLTWFVVFAALLVIASAAVRYLRRDDPAVLGFRLTQAELGLTLFMLVVLFSMVTSDKHVIFGSGLRAIDPVDEIGISAGWGAVLMLIGALTASVGAALNHLGAGPVLRPGPGSTPGPGEPPPPGQVGPPPPGPTGPPPAPGAGGPHTAPGQPPGPVAGQ